MDERVKFVAACLAGDETMSALCARYSISRKTGYKWLGRYKAHGVEGLVDLPRKPLHHGRSTSQEVVDQVLMTKQAHPLWGPKRILAHLQEAEPGRVWPAPSTIGEILKRSLTRDAGTRGS